MAADQEIHERMYKLINKGINNVKWTLDQALHEFATVRTDVETLLAGRPRGASRNTFQDNGKGLKGKKGSRGLGKGSYRSDPYDPPPPKDKGNGKGGKKDKDKGKSTGKVVMRGGRFPPGWQAAWATLGPDKSTPISLKRHTSGCTFGAGCKYNHSCPVKLPSGKFCLQDHAAWECPAFDATGR